MYSKEFLEMISVLVDDISLTGDIVNYHEIFSKEINELNAVLKLDKQKEFKDVESGILMAPVPFVASGEDIQVAILGLNPLWHEFSGSEVEAAGTTWESYAEFYTSSAIIRKALDVPRNPYYESVFNILMSLRERVFTPYGEYFRGLSRANKIDKYINLIEDYNICVAESLPFRSSNTDTIDMELLYERLPRYKQYTNKLFAFLADNLAPNGWLVANGKAAKEALDLALGAEMKLINENRERAYSLYQWKGRHVLAFHEFFRRRNGKLNSYHDIEEMFMEVFSIVS